jgi:hypothetical protein
MSDTTDQHGPTLQSLSALIPAKGNFKYEASTNGELIEDVGRARGAQAKSITARLQNMQRAAKKKNKASK